MCSPDGLEEEHQVAEMSVADRAGVDLEEEAAERSQVEYSLPVQEVERLAGHSSVCFVERKFDSVEAKQEGTCPGYILPVLAVLIFEAPFVATSRIDLTLTVAVEAKRIRFEVRRLDERSGVAEVAAR